MSKYNCLICGKSVGEFLSSTACGKMFCKDCCRNYILRKLVYEELSKRTNIRINKLPENLRGNPDIYSFDPRELFKELVRSKPNDYNNIIKKRFDEFEEMEE